jgi:hypothetical protein
MDGYHDLTPEERVRVTEIQDLLIERYVEKGVGARTSLGAQLLRAPSHLAAGRARL